MSKTFINDGGHGGTDPGAVAFGQHEKEWSLEASLYVNDRLRELGLISTVTRSGDYTLDSNERTKIVRDSKANVCFSHHFNAGKGTGAEFIHSIHANNTLSSYLKEEFSKEGMKTRRIFTRKLDNGKDYYYMHRETGFVETVIIEYGFLDNEEDFSRLKDKAFRYRLYEAVVKAACRYANVPYKVKEGQTKKTTDKKTATFYRVVTGSFSDRENAEKRIDDLKKAGFDSFIDIFEK